jgi:hypothetical protein
VKHVACANYAFFNEVEHKEPANCEAGGPSPARTKDELMRYLSESFAYAGQVMRRLTPANALDVVEDPYGGKTTRLGISTLAVWHATDGSLRAAGGVSADERDRAARERRHGPVTPARS